MTPEQLKPYYESKRLNSIINECFDPMYQTAIPIGGLQRFAIALIGDMEQQMVEIKQRLTTIEEKLNA